MAEPRETDVRGDVACPFCGLACDDLEIEVAAERLTLRRGACPISRAQFERHLPKDAAPQLGGRDCGRGEAVAAAAEILRRARLPVFGGLATDVEGLRGALALADRTGGVIDHRGSRALFADLTALRDIGSMTTTFSEVRNRADLLLIVGPDPLSAMPRFLERCFSDRPTLFAETGLARRLVHLGADPDAAPALPPGLRYTPIPCAAEALAPAVGRLRAVVKGRGAKGRAQAAGEDAALIELAGALRAAGYAVVAWMASLLPPEAADLIVLSLVEMVRDLNLSHRAACLPLGGAENLAGANQACLWQSGHPLRTGFGTGAPRHDPFLHSAERLIESGEADALLWISTLGSTAAPIGRPDLPLILLAPPGVETPAPPAVFLPVGRPGIDHAGQIFRADGIVALPLAALRPSPLQSAGETLRAIAEAMESA
jgi:formylmethanofuran dehydrogenase subunit B